MKYTFTLIKTLSVILLSVISFSANAQCPTVLTPSVTYNGYNGEVTVESHFDVTPLTGKIVYHISGAPGSYSIATTSMTNSVTFYNIAGGSYSLCVVADSLAGGCAAVMGCEAFVSNVPVCDASFTYSTDASCVTHFVSTSTGSSLQSRWEINGSFYNTPNVDVSLPDGSYYVSLINDVMIGPSSFMSCDTANQTVNISCNPCSVNASFNLVADTDNPGDFYLYNTSTGNGELSYVWDFGDGTALSTQNSPVHQYAVPGQYIVCFTVTSTNTVTGSDCSASYCDSSSVHRTATGFLMSKITVVPSVVTAVKSADLFSGLKTYPNPIKDQLTIEMKLATKETLIYAITDAFGKILIKNEIEGSATSVNTSSLTQGFYVLSITDSYGKTLKAMKLIK